jgi:hypothetical protein
MPLESLLSLSPGRYPQPDPLALVNPLHSDPLYAYAVVVNTRSLLHRQT